MARMKLRVGRHDFSVSCESGEEPLLSAAAATVEREMETARRAFQAADGERAAVMAALLVAFSAEKKLARTGEKAPETGLDAVKIRELSDGVRAVLARTGSPQERDGT